jgi:hypothetical protein
VPADVAAREIGVPADVAVGEVGVPDDVAGLAGLDRIDYREGFAFDTGVRRTPEAWARLILAGAPLSDRITMIATWTALGIRLALPGSSGQVLGWRILHNDAESIVLGVRAAAGLTARLVVSVGEGTVLQAMVVRYDSARGAKIWHALGPKHRKFVAGLLIRASGQIGRTV